MTTDPLVRRFNPAGPNYGPSGLDTPLRDEERREAAFGHIDYLKIEMDLARIRRYALRRGESFESVGIVYGCDEFGNHYANFPPDWHDNYALPFIEQRRTAVSLGGTTAQISEP